MATEKKQPWHKWYKTKLWASIRKQQLTKQPLCERHLAKTEIVVATTVHHKLPHKGNWDLFKSGPFESVCKSCHDSIIQSEERLGYSIEIGTDGWPVDAKHPVNSK